MVLDDRVGELRDRGRDGDDERQVEQELEWRRDAMHLMRVACAHPGQQHGGIVSGVMVGDVVEMRGLEPLTPAMRTRCSPS